MDRKKLAEYREILAILKENGAMGMLNDMRKDFQESTGLTLRELDESDLEDEESAEDEVSE